MFDLRTVDSWGMWGALVGYIVFFRFMQYMLFAYQTGSFDWMFQSAGSAAPVVVDGANGSGGAADTGKGML